MVNDFDKEIDAMLRDFAKNPQTAFTIPQTVHLDADEISAFAENALPNKARVRATEHFADCSKCRKILANTFFLNSAEESETIHDEVITIISEPVIPWYKRLFAGPNLAYAMGAMALILVGMVGFLVLQNSNRSEPTIAQANKVASEKSSGPNAGGLEGDSFPTPSYAANSTANTASASNTSAPAANAPAANAPISKDGMPMSPINASNSNIGTFKDSDGVVVTKDVDDKTLKAGKTDEQPLELAKKEAPKPVGTPATEDAPINEKGGERQEVNKSNEVSQNRNIQNVSPDTNNAQQRVYTPPPSTASGASRDEQAERERSAPSMPKKKATEPELKSRSVVTEKVGNKSFRSTNGVWIDTSYTGGSTQNVKRGSSEYKKLDSGLQKIGNSLSGTVIVVWSGKNYKIQ